MPRESHDIEIAVARQNALQKTVRHDFREGGATSTDRILKESQIHDIALEHTIQLLIQDQAGYEGVRSTHQE